MNITGTSKAGSNGTCNNCGKVGHSFHQCKLPISSYGIIAFRSSSRGIEYLMIRRKDSFGFIDFLRGKYSPYNLVQIQGLVDEMSLEEKERILTVPFPALWRSMWGDTSTSGGQYRSEEHSSARKFEIVKAGITVPSSDRVIPLKDIVASSATEWIETEWEFPKGRRNYREKDLDCALREFEEETGISQSRICVIENVLPFEEVFIGTNHKSYKHKFFLAYMRESDSDQESRLDQYQISEVSKLEWKTLGECLASIRPYNLEKKELIRNINTVLEEYRLYL